MAEYERVEADRRERLAQARAGHDLVTERERSRIQAQHDLVDHWEADFTARGRKAVADYFHAVLSAQRYPSDFPTGVKVAYLPPEREVRVDIDLPVLASIPELVSCECQPVKKTLKHARLREPARHALYQKVIAQMALRTVRAVFLADRGGLAGSIVCNGYVDTINTATGQPAHWPLVSMRVTREDFDGLDLAGVSGIS